MGDYSELKKIFKRGNSNLLTYKRENARADVICGAHSCHCPYLHNTFFSIQVTLFSE